MQYCKFVLMASTLVFTTKQTLILDQQNYSVLVLVQRGEVLFRYLRQAAAGERALVAVRDVFLYLLLQELEVVAFQLALDALVGRGVLVAQHVFNVHLHFIRPVASSEGRAAVAQNS